MLQILLDHDITLMVGDQVHRFFIILRIFALIYEEITLESKFLIVSQFNDIQAL